MLQRDSLKDIINQTRSSRPHIRSRRTQRFETFRVLFAAGRARTPAGGGGEIGAESALSVSAISLTFDDLCLDALPEAHVHVN